jgi:AAA family ATP:ADP antiporter
MVGPLNSWRKRSAAWLAVEPAELPALAAGFMLFFLLFASYMMLRPVRETMGIAGGVDNLQWLFLATFLATLVFIPLFGGLAAAISRRALLPASYVFSAATLAILGIEMQVDPANVWLGRLFYVWLSVLNLFLISVAWSVMCDVFAQEQARRLFGPIAAGASLGALAGPMTSGLLVPLTGHGGVLIISAILLLGTLPFAAYLFRWRGSGSGSATSSSDRIGGSIVAGLTLLVRSPYLLGIALFVVLLASVSTFLYLEQARLIASTVPDPVRQTQLFSAIDTVVQGATLLVQVFVTPRIARKLGVTVLLASIPILMVFGFAALAVSAALPMLLLIVVLRRVGEYAFARPGREMLFTSVGEEERYKAKNVIDTVVYRGGDALSAWLRSAVESVGANVLLMGVGLAALWGAVGWWLGRSYDRKAPIPLQPASEVS